METDKILILNAGSVEHLCTNLREILERSTDLKVKVEQRSLLETLSGGFECGQISNAITHFRPRVIFLVWAGKNFEQVNAALASIRAESRDIPLFAVLDADAPGEIMGLLQIGVEDFITPPLKPPLRQRREDIPLLARHFLATIASRLAVRPKDISAGAIQKLLLHDWPGNVRELEHVMERAVALSERTEIQRTEIDLPGSRQTANPESFQQSKAKVVAEFETSFVRRLLEGHQGNITRAAQSAHKDRRLFRQLIRKHQIDVDQFKPAGR